MNAPVQQAMGADAKEIRMGKEYQFYSLKDTGIRDLANSEGIVIAGPRMHGIRMCLRQTDISAWRRACTPRLKVSKEPLKRIRTYRTHP